MNQLPLRLWPALCGMAAGDYAHKPGGSLKFKGGEGSKKKKKWAANMPERY